MLVAVKLGVTLRLQPMKYAQSCQMPATTALVWWVPFVRDVSMTCFQTANVELIQMCLSRQRQRQRQLPLFACFPVCIRTGRDVPGRRQPWLRCSWIVCLQRVLLATRLAASCPRRLRGVGSVLWRGYMGKSWGIAGGMPVTLLRTNSTWQLRVFSCY